MEFTDQLGRTISLTEFPTRIVSLVPSQTELLADLGLDEEVIAITKFCVHPENWFRTKTRIGGTKQINLEKIDALQPDLVIGNKEENERGQILALMEKHTVWMSDIKTLPDALEMIRSLGVVTKKKKKADLLAAEIEARFAAFRANINTAEKKRVAYFIWKNPWMVAGSDTFINELLQVCGWENVFSATAGRYPEVTLEELKNTHPEIILLSSEPYPFKDKHILELQETCPQAKILLVDGEIFSWYGSRLLQSPGYFNELLASLS